MTKLNPRFSRYELAPGTIVWRVKRSKTVGYCVLRGSVLRVNAYGSVALVGVKGIHAPQNFFKCKGDAIGYAKHMLTRYLEINKDTIEEGSIKNLWVSNFDAAYSTDPKKSRK